ncbi:Poly(ADP-ribose) glycohydrolase [Armadillidium vulgare]|nr:Poly(ADP-ribose) glycohydrolase [Armadillidium vulgare]
MITSEEPEGVVTLTRAKPENFPFESCGKPLPNLELKLEGGIEDAKDHLQVDFADKYIGGMIFTKGCVQEEIRFLVCPELIISRLLTEVLDDDEAIIITVVSNIHHHAGIEQYNLTSGFGHQFRFVSSFQDQTPRDKFRRRKCQLIAIDALNFNRRTNQQFEPVYIKRELRKAYAGFLAEEGTERPFAPVATGNWGCGVFRGTPHLKSLIQLVAAGASERDVSYFAFGNKNLVKDLGELYVILKDKNVTIGKNNNLARLKSKS